MVDEFFRTLAPVAIYISKKTGEKLKPESILVQCADESGFDVRGCAQGHENWKGHYNMAGISPNGVIADYPNYQSFADAYVSTIMQNAFGFPQVLEAGTIELQLIRLGQSKWAGSQYDREKSGRPGIDLLTIWRDYRGLIEDALQQTSPQGPNEDVRHLQEQLNELGYHLAADGLYGPITEETVKHFQEKAGLQVDGIAGPITQAEIVKEIEDLKKSQQEPKAPEQVQAASALAETAPTVQKTETAAPVIPPKTEPAATQTQNVGLSFGQAIETMKLGHKVMRAGWNGKGMWVELQSPDANSKMTLPYFYIEYPAGHPAYPNGCRVPWFPSQTDLLSNDWQLA